MWGAVYFIQKYTNPELKLNNLMNFNSTQNVTQAKVTSWQLFQETA